MTEEGRSQPEESNCPALSDIVIKLELDEHDAAVAGRVYAEMTCHLGDLDGDEEDPEATAAVVHLASQVYQYAGQYRNQGDKQAVYSLQQICAQILPEQELSGLQAFKIERPRLGISVTEAAESLKKVAEALLAGDLNERECRVCGCTENAACEGDDGEPCHWVEWDLCSACHVDVKGTAMLTMTETDAADLSKEDAARIKCKHDVPSNERCQDCIDEAITEEGGGKENT